MSRQRMSPLARNEERLGYLFISPWILGLLIFTLFPLVATFLISFTDWDIYNPPKWVGLKNYFNLFTDKLFFQSLKVTLLYSLFSIPLTLAGGLILALLLNANIRFIHLFRTIFYIPSVITGVAVAMLWIWIFNAHYGLLNYFLSWFGIEGPKWLEDPKWILPTYVLISLWKVGGNAVLFLGGLQNIPQHLYEAARMDGANRWQIFWKITLPLLTPTLFFLLLMGIIDSFKIFTTAYMINDGGGGPDNAGLFYMLYLYQKAFVSLDMGYASAMAWIGGGISLILAIVVYRTQSKWVYYEADVGKKGSDQHGDTRA
ncbi:sugar ABC transporter permease [Brevibacillus sp. SYP-B805]|uniref:carbohydrate ABC transporter permease n=1 Tax=Brevibacillus sp. SYP-B805 TaxID=1578199 RepID=UPI0013EDFA52|nr:sugar ABC transporter permease [Brevibacillus sp. SYP-B805]NGQ95862.1 sugar ABC transporter permease [Brevibacillus sp. SYP-B805]